MAVKFIRYTTEDQKKMAHDELKTMKMLKHKSIVRLFGETTKSQHGRKDFGILMEFCDKNTLIELVLDSKIIYSMKTVLYWAIRLFSALRYLFERHNLVHRDIRPHNIFVKSIPKRNAPYTLKLGDFGLAQVEGTCRGTVTTYTRYASPPSTRGTKDEWDFHRMDVYSLGLILWEIVERRVVLERFNCAPGGKFDRARLIMEMFRSHDQYKEHEPPNCPQDLQQLITCCLSLDHTNRPKAAACFQRLQEIKTELEERPAFRSLAQFPSEEEDLIGCIRPIGFDETLKRHYALKKKLSVNKIRKFKRYLESLENQKFMDNELGQNLRLASEIVKRYNELSNEEKILMIATFSQLIQMQERRIFQYQEEAAIDKEWKKCTDVFFAGEDKKNIEKLFESMIVHDISMLIKKLRHFFELLNLNQFEQITAEMLRNQICDLKELEKVRFVTNIFFPCYFQTSKHKEWFLITKTENRFVSADLREVRDFNGIWFSDGKNDHFSIRNEKVMQEFSKHDELRFLRLAPAPLQSAIKNLKEILEILTKPIVEREFETLKRETADTLLTTKVEVEKPKSTKNAVRFVEPKLLS